MLRILLYLLPVILAIYALIDCVQTPDSQVRGLPKIAWVILIVLIWVVGPVAWLMAGRDRSAGSTSTGWLGAGGLGGSAGSPGRSGRPGRVVGPDDDPEFLRRLDSHFTEPQPSDRADDSEGPEEPTAR